MFTALSNMSVLPSAFCTLNLSNRTKSCSIGLSATSVPCLNIVFPCVVLNLASLSVLAAAGRGKLSYFSF